MSSEVMVRAVGVGKAHEFYAHQADRFKQIVWGRYKTYCKRHWVLRDINFELRRGESLGIIGRNGVGKSTLLQLICGISFPTCGDIEVSGRIAPVLALGAGFDPDLTGRENVLIGGVVLGLRRGEVRERFEAIADFAGIGEFMEQPVRFYSTGMYTRLAFAICAHVDADLLIVDEALAVGDAAFRNKCFDFLKRFRARGSLLLVSHDTSQVKILCEQALWIDNGRMRAQGDAATVSDAYVEALRDEPDDVARFVIESEGP